MAGFHALLLAASLALNLRPVLMLPDGVLRVAWGVLADRTQLVVDRIIERM